MSTLKSRVASRCRKAMRRSLRPVFGLVIALLPLQLVAHSVGQRQTTKFLAPDTVQMLVDRANSGAPGLKAGDIISYIIQFSPVANGATIGVAGYVTDYIPPNTQVVGASIVVPGGSGFIDVAPGLPGTIPNGWGSRGQNTFSAPFNTSNYDSTGLCGAAGKSNNCNGSLAELHADTGIFFSRDPRTAVFPAVPTRIAQGTNGYYINPTAVGQLDSIVGNPSNVATTHNLWDAAMTNAFGTKTLPGATPRSTQPILNADGNGAAPFGAGSPVAGPQTGYPLDYTGTTGPWQRIAYTGSRVGSTNAGPATNTGTTLYEPTADLLAIKGSPTSAGHVLSPSNPLPADTNAVRWAIGGLVVGQTKYVRISVRLLAAPPVDGIINGSEVFGGDAAAGDNGKDNPWRYHVPSVADNNSNLYVLKKVVCVYSGATCVPGDGNSVPENAKIRYRVTYLNTGNLPQTNVVLQDTLPAQAVNNAVSNAALISGPNILPFSPANAGSGATITFQTLPMLGPGAGGAVEFDVQTDGRDGDNVANLARLSSTQIPSPGVTSTAVSNVQKNTAALNIAKTVTPATTTPGGTVTYTITVSNTGTGPASSIIVDEFLPSDDGAGGSNNAATRFNFVAGSSNFSGMTGVTPTLTSPATVAPYAGLNRQQVTWSFGSQTLAAGASFTITFQAAVGASVPTRAQAYTNDAKVTYGGVSVTTVATAGVVVRPPVSLTHVKSVQVVSDPFNGSTNPKAIPGAVMEYTLQIANSGGGNVDSNTVDVVDPVPANTRLFLGDIGSSGPVVFVNGSPSSGLTWTFSSLGSVSDDLEFSNNGGSTWTHVPTVDGSGYDVSAPPTTHIRMRPKGAMAGNTGSGNPSFQLRFRVRIN
jgi:uncharacterized repeat protein (TIGR01451 family)